MQILKFASTTSLFALLASAAAAHAQGFYVDGGYSRVSTDLADDAIELDEDDLDDLGDLDDVDISLDFDFDVLGGHFGYEFSPYFSIEGEILIGISEETFSTTIRGESETDADIDASVDFSLNSIYGLYARGSYPLTDQF